MAHAPEQSIHDNLWEGGSPAYPLALTNLANVRCVVVGGGAVAERKVRDLIAGGAQPQVISPALTDALTGWRNSGHIVHIVRAYQAGDLSGAFLAVAATDDRRANAEIAAEGARLGILVNVADQPADGNFHTLAVVRRGDLLLAVSTSGGSPSLTARIRRDLAARYGEEYAHLVELLRKLRGGPALVLSPERRALLWQRLISDTVLAWLRNGDTARAEQYAREQLEELSSQ